MTDTLKISSMIFFLVFFSGLSTCLAQHDLNDMYLKEGVVIHEENSLVSTGQFRVSGYRLGRVRLPKPIEMRQGPPMESVFRIVIVTSNSLPTTQQYSIWIGDHQLGTYHVRPNEFAGLLYSKTLPSGVFTLGLSKQSDRNEASRAILPEKLFVPPEYATPPEELEAARPRINLYRRGNTVELVLGNAGKVV